MQKQLGAIMLIAGTAIGSGMIALPMVLSKLGLFPSIGLMIFMGIFMYVSSLMTLELNLQAGHSLHLGAMGRHFGGKTAGFIGTVCLKILSYALLAAYIYGGASIVQKLITHYFSHEYAFQTIATLFTVGILFVLAGPLKQIDYINRMMFIGLIIVVAILIMGLSTNINTYALPLLSGQESSLNGWTLAIPVMFTSFGFQGSLPAITRYCGMDKKILKRAIFWGSFIPVCVYILWTCSVLSVIFLKNPTFYNKMIEGHVEVGDMIKELSLIAEWSAVQTFAWWISILAIMTSVIGVALGLIHAFEQQLEHRSFLKSFKQSLSVFLTFLPPYMIAILVPNAFISILGFAGMILAFIAILIPSYLIYKGKFKTFYYKRLQNSFVRILLTALGMGIIVCEIINMVR
jgi:tyrosine-specific transport protein